MLFAQGPRSTEVTETSAAGFIRSLLDSAAKIHPSDTANYLKLVEQALDKAVQLQNEQYIGLALQYKSKRLRPAESLVLLQRALEIARKQKDSAQMVSVYHDMGFRYSVLDRRSHALDCFFNSLRILDRRPNPKDLAFVYASIGTIYAELEDPKGIEYLEKGLSIRASMSDSSRLVNFFLNLGNAYHQAGQVVKAIDYTERSLRWAEKRGSLHLVTAALENLCKFYLDLRDADLQLISLGRTEMLQKVKSYAEKSLAIGKQQSLPTRPVSYLFLARVHLAKGQHAEALAHLRLAYTLAHENGQNLYNMVFHDAFSQVYGAMKNYDSALYHHQLFKRISDSLRSSEMIKMTTRKQVEYDFSKIEDSLQQVQLLTAGKLKEQELLALQRKQSLELQKALLELSDQQRQLSDLAYEKANAELLAQQTTLSERNKQLTIAEQEKQLQKGQVALQASQLLQAQTELSTKRRQQYFYILGMVLLSLLFYTLFRNFRNKQKAKAELAAEKLKVQKAETVRRLAEFEMHGLRAQLNPHFMFNSLNAIQEQILRENTETAIDYLTSFSRMLRQLLENAEYSFVTLAKELDFLKLYLTMEQLRIPELEFTIDVDPEVDTQHTMIPNMILQPYLENAIWHGLSPKPGAKRVEVRIEDRDQGILVKIMDNGVGREKAAELKSRYRRAHQSKGMTLLKKRFELIKVEFGSAIQIHIEDLSVNGQPSGTMVQLEIPYALSQPAMMHETISSN